MIGKYHDKTLEIEGPSNSEVFMTTNEGVITTFLEIETEGFEYLKNLISPILGEVNEIKILIVTGLAVGDDIPQWENYEDITR